MQLKRIFVTYKSILEKLKINTVVQRNSILMKFFFFFLNTFLNQICCRGRNVKNMKINKINIRAKKRRKKNEQFFHNNLKNVLD